MAISIQKAKGSIKVAKASQLIRTNDRIQIRRATGTLKVQRPKSTVSANVAVKKSPVIVKREGIQIAKKSPVLIDYAKRSKSMSTVGKKTSKKNHSQAQAEKTAKENAVHVAVRTPSQPRPTSGKRTPKVKIQKANHGVQARVTVQKTTAQNVSPHRLTIQKKTAPQKPAANTGGDNQIQKRKMTVRVGNRPKPSAPNTGAGKQLQEDKQLSEPQFYVSIKTAHAAPKLHPSLKPVDKTKPLSIVSARKQILAQERKQKQEQKRQLAQKQLSEQARLTLERDRLEQDRMDQREKARQQARIAQKKRLREQLDIRRMKQQAATAAQANTPSATKTPPSRENNKPAVALLSRALKKATKQPANVSMSKDSSLKSIKPPKKRKLDSPSDNKASKAQRSAKQAIGTTNLKGGVRIKQNLSSTAVADKKTGGSAKSAIKITVKPKSVASGVPNNQAPRPTPTKGDACEPSKPTVAVVTKMSKVKVGEKAVSRKSVSKIANKTASKPTLGVTVTKKLMANLSPSLAKPSSKQNTSAAVAGGKGSDKRTPPALAAQKRSVSTKTATNTIPTKLKQTPKRKRTPTSNTTAGKARATTHLSYQMTDRWISFQNRTEACLLRMCFACVLSYILAKSTSHKYVGFSRKKKESAVP